MSLLKELFNNSLPVFVAATISRAATSVLALTSTDLTTLIWVTFGYSVLFVQTLGILVCTKSDHSADSFHYYMHVCSECAGFAWKEFVVLIMLKWLFVNKNIGYATGAWLILVLCAFAGVYLFNAVLALYFKPTGKVFTSLRKFNSDAFALAISFSFTLVVASFLYPADSSHSLAGTDDIIKDPDSAIEDVHGAGWYFFAYAVFITVIMSFVQHKIGWLVEKADDALEGRDSVLSVRMSADSDDGYRFSFDAPSTHEEGYWKSIDSVDPDSQAMIGVLAASGKNPLNNGVLLREDPLISPVIRATHSTTDGGDSAFSKCNLWWSYIDNVIFAWDPRGYCKQSLMHMGNTVAGYTVGCAWYTFSLLTFQKEFTNIPAGDVLGLFIYSVGMTLAVTLIMSRIERTQGKKLQEKLKKFGRDSSVTMDVVEKFTARYKRNNELALVAGRLACGWSWADFFTSCFTSALSDEQREITQYKSSNWLGAIIKCFVAVIIIVTGKYIDEYLVKRRLNKMNGGTSFRSPGMKLTKSEQEAKRQTEQVFARENFSPSRLPDGVASAGNGARLTSSLLGDDDDDSEDEVVI